MAKTKVEEVWMVSVKTIAAAALAACATACVSSDQPLVLGDNPAHGIPDASDTGAVAQDASAPEEGVGDGASDAFATSDTPASDTAQRMDASDATADAADATNDASDAGTRAQDASDAGTTTADASDAIAASDTSRDTGSEMDATGGMDAITDASEGGQ